MTHVYRTDFHIDIDLLRSETDALLDMFGDEFRHNQFGLTHSPNIYPGRTSFNEGTGSLWEFNGDRRETDFTEFNLEFNNTIFREIYDTFPYRIGRMRIMRSDPKSCLSMHEDQYSRYHFAIRTNRKCFMVFSEGLRGYHIPADGWAYYAQTRREHTAINANLQDFTRVHLLLDAPWDREI